MLIYTIRRILIMVPTLLAISAIVFLIIQLPPGDYLETHISQLEADGQKVDLEKIEALRRQYGLDRPIYEQYSVWVWGMLQGDMGYSFAYQLPVNQVVGDRLWLSFLVAFTTILFTYAVSFPIGIYSAVRQYSLGDYAFSFLGFLGLATPNFLLALVLLYFANVYFGTSIGGLMDDAYIDQPWTWGKFLSVLEHREELAPGPGLVDVGVVHQAADRGAEIDVGKIQQHQGEQEVGRRQAEEAQEAEGVVAQAVLAHRRVDADRKGHRVGEEDRREGNQEAEPQAVADHLIDRQLIGEGIAHVTLQHAPDPDAVLFVDRPVQAVLPAQRLDLLQVDLLAVRLKLADVGLQVIARRQLDDQEDDGADGQQRRHHDQNAADRVDEHDLVRP